MLLTAKDVAKFLRVSLSWVYEHKRALGALQLIPGGSVRFNEQHLQELIHAIPNAEREMARKAHDKRENKDKGFPNQNRSEKMGGSAERRRMAGAGRTDPYGICP